MIVLETEEQRKVLLALTNSATFQGVENARRLVELDDSLRNAKIEDCNNKTGRQI